MDWHSFSAEKTAQLLKSDIHKGLSESEAKKRLEKNGANELRGREKPSVIKRFFAQFKDFCVIILFIACIISFATGILEGKGDFIEPVVILIIVILNAVIGVIQEQKAEKAIEALKKMSAPTACTVRGGKTKNIPASSLVDGDIIFLESGDMVPDARLISSNSLRIQESSLTGESVPVTKDAAANLDAACSLADRKNMIYSSTTVMAGNCTAIVTETGMNTKVGKIAGLLAEEESPQTPLQQRLEKVGKALGIGAVAICAVVFVLGILRHSGLLPSFMLAVSLAVAAIPEGLPAVVTVVLSMGVQRLAKSNAIIRFLPAVETLGAATVICSDKTGTLTQNKMTVVDHVGQTELVATAMALCSDANLNGDNQAEGEPTECALVNFAYSVGLHKADLEKATPRVDEAPFDSGRKMMSTVHDLGGSFVQYTKGGPDVVLARCTAYYENGEVKPMTEEKRAEIMAANKAMADKALRVLAVAKRDWKEKPTDNSPEFLEQDLVFLGLTGMIDPVRPEVKAAIEECRRAGIRPVMITGDHKDTAVAIAKELGIITDASQAITGAELDDISDEDICEFVKRYGVYARVQPEHKTRIVNAWKQNGAITAMTGDGVNDAPSIKSADIGVGMGITGTDVTKNVADMVLADDNFATIVSAVGEGRRIYDNIRKAIQFLLASNMSEVLGVFGATLMGFTLLRPVHLLFINLVTDCFPALALGMEKEEPDTMNRPPRDSKEGIFAGGLFGDIIYQGILVTALTVISYLIGSYFEFGAKFFAQLRAVGASDHGMTMAFLTMSMCEIFHSFNLRSQRKSIFSLKGQNKILWAAMLGSLVLTTLLLEVPFLANAFGFVPVGWEEYGIALVLGFLVIPVVELVKLVQRAIARKK